MSNELHVLGVAHTIPHEDYLVCAFTAKVLLFPEVIQPFGWHVVEYSNEGSASQAHEHIVILAKERLQALSKRQSREEPLDADVGNNELQEEFQRILVEKIRVRARPGDIVCHVYGPNMGVFDALPECRHVELSVGYTASPGLPFRVFESAAWMHWHYGKAGQEDGNHYKWVIPSAFDEDKWAFREETDDYAIFLGRVTPRKGMNELVDIAARMPELPIHVYGPGDPSEWAARASPNLIFMGPAFGNRRIDVVRRARCMLMPTVFIEPFGFSGIEAQLCGVPLIASSFGAFQETVVEGVTGYRCHTLADWVEAITLSWALDRRRIAALARSKYSKEVVGKQYDWALRQLGDLSGRGWYGDRSRKFAAASVAAHDLQARTIAPRKRRIWLYIPYFGAFPNYFQLYLDSLGRNSDCLSVFLMTDIDLSGYQLPENLVPIPMTLAALRERCARLISDEFRREVSPDALLKQAKKLIDFKITYPQLFFDIGARYGVTEDDFVGWGDIDLIYGRFSNFLNIDEDYQIIGGFHGHVTAFRNSASFRKLFNTAPNLPEILVDEKVHIADEIAFREPLKHFLERNRYEMFYINRYFCDIVPECFIEMFRPDHAQRSKNFFDAYNADKDINHVHCGNDGSLTVVYDNGELRQSIYCHLQKRAMTVEFDQNETGYYICEDAFRLRPPTGQRLDLSTSWLHTAESFGAMAPAEPSRWRVLTCFDTLIYLDVDSGEFRHGEVRLSPRNVCITASRQGTSIEISGQTASKIKPSVGAGAPVPSPISVKNAGSAQNVMLYRDGALMTAQADGSVTFGAQRLRTWEVLRLVPEHHLDSERYWLPPTGKGGTSLMVERLHGALGEEMKGINLNVDRPSHREGDLRPSVVWIHNRQDLWIYDWCRDPEQVSKVARFVFVSHWQRQKFIEHFSLPAERCEVIRNAIEMNAATRSWPEQKPWRWRCAYISAPFRGLDVLLDAWRELSPTDAELHIWSGVSLWNFDDSAHRPLFARAMETANVTYHRIAPNAVIRAALLDMHFLVYPATTDDETFCLSMVEAMSSGCRVIAPARTALPEIAAGFARMYPSVPDPSQHKRLFMRALADELANPWGGRPEMAEAQQAHCRATYDWNGRIEDWRRVIEAVRA